MNKYVTNYHFYTNYRNINFISQHLNDTNSYLNHCYRHRKKKQKKKNNKQTNKKKQKKNKKKKKTRGCLVLVLLIAVFVSFQP